MFHPFYEQAHRALRVAGSVSLIALGLACAPAQAQNWPEVKKSAFGLQGPAGDQRGEQRARARAASVESAPRQALTVIDQEHAERQASFYSGRVSHPIYDLPLDYLDHPGMSAQDKVYLAQTLLPLDLDNPDVRSLVQNGSIACTPLTCVRNGKVIGYNYREYERLKAQVDASPAAPVQPSGAVPVKGRWHDAYPIYGFDKVDTELNGPAYAGNKVFLDPFEVIAALTPVELADIRNRFRCHILCWAGEDILGYDPVAFARYKRLFQAKSPDERAAFYEQIKRKHADGVKAREDAQRASTQAKAQHQAKQAWQAAYTPPPMSNPRTASRVPVEVIRNAITGNQAAFRLTTWKEQNTYVLNREGEAVHYIEYTAQWDLKKENIEYLNSSGGISFPSARRQTSGTIGVVKRGNSWYQVAQ